MSVRVNERNQASTEYYRQFTIIYNIIQEKMLQIAKRKKKWYANKIMDKLNEIGRIIIKIDKGFIMGYKKSEIRRKYAIDTIEKLYGLQQLLWILWANEKYKDKTMDSWCESLNRIMELTNEYANLETIEKFTKIDWKKVKELRFLNTIAKLDSEAYSFAMRLSNKFSNLYAEKLLGSLDDCFCNLLSANKIYPTNHKEYVQRRQHISDAICSLQEASEAIRDLAIHKQLPEEQIASWSENIKNEFETLKGLNLSDKRRFGKL